MYSYVLKSTAAATGTYYEVHVCGGGMYRTCSRVQYTCMLTFVNLFNLVHEYGLLKFSELHLYESSYQCQYSPLSSQRLEFGTT